MFFALICVNLVNQLNAQYYAITYIELKLNVKILQL